MTPRRRSRSTAPEPEPKLLVRKSQLDEDLQQRLGLGQAMLDLPVRNREEQKQLRHDLSTWDEFNEQLLRRRFSTPKVANGYRRVVVGFGGAAPLDKEIEWTRASISSQMRKLESIRLQL